MAQRRISPSTTGQGNVSIRYGLKRFTVPIMHRSMRCSPNFLPLRKLLSRSTSLNRRNVEEPCSVPTTPDTPPHLEAACFGVAGPVIQNHCQTTNLPWVVDGATLAKQFDIRDVKLLNDLEAMAHGILLLRPDELVILNAGTPPSHNQALALIAAGTGLGESILFWNGSPLSAYAVGRRACGLRTEQ